MLLVTVIWGSNFSISKFALQGVPPLTFSAVRFSVASILLLLIARRMGANATVPRRTLYSLIGLGIVGNTVYQTMFMTGLSMTSATNSAMIIAALPVIVAVLGTLLGIERATPMMWVGVVLGTAGVLLVVTAKGVQFSPESLRGDALVFAAMFCWAFYTVGVRRIGTGINPLQITAITTAGGTPGLILLGIPGVIRQNWSGVSAETWGAMAYSAFLALVVCYLLYNRAVQAIGSGRTALYNCVTPLVAMVIAWLVLSEVPTPMQFLGVALVISGVLVSVASHRATPRDVPSPAGGAG